LPLLSAAKEMVARQRRVTIFRLLFWCVAWKKETNFMENQYFSKMPFITTVIWKSYILLSHSVLLQQLLLKLLLLQLLLLFVCLLGVRGKPRINYRLLAYCTARFGRSNFGRQMSPRLPTRFAL
jgi:hypothetical protein